MKIDLQGGKLLRILGGAGSTVTAHAGSRNLRPAALQA